MAYIGIIKHRDFDGWVTTIWAENMADLEAQVDGHKLVHVREVPE